MKHELRSLMLCLTLSTSASMTGCGAIVKSHINTQPRVSIEAEATANPDSIVGGTAVQYNFGSSVSGCDPDLVAYAPIIIQGVQVDPDNTLDSESDAIGMPVCNANGRSIRVDTAAPTVFGRVEHAMAYGTSLKQLTYVYWYPKREAGTIETGEVDGGIFRITLDAQNQPAIFEFSQTCGCYHGVFASSRAETLAKLEFGNAVAKREHALEAAETDGEWIVRDVVDAEAGLKPVLYLSAGEHFCELLRFVSADQPLHVQQQRSYVLDHYDRLEAIPSDAGGTASMFNKQKLVLGAQRWKEELVFTDINHPGWPRHLDVMLIHWDHDRWTDPALLQQNLRLPHALASPPSETAHAGG